MEFYFYNLKEKIFYYKEKKLYKISFFKKNKKIKKFRLLNKKIRKVESINLKIKIKNVEISYIKINKIKVLKKMKISEYKYKYLMIELFDIILLIYIDSEFSFEKLYKRYFEGFDISYRNLINEDSYFFYEGILDNIILKKEKIEYKMLDFYLNSNSMNRFVYFDKKTKEYVEISKKNLFRKNKIHDFTFNIQKIKYLKKETGYRIGVDVLKIINHVGRLYPIVSITDKTELDKIGFPIYISNSSSDKNDFPYSFHGGKGFSEIQSKMSAIGEAAERYSSRILGNEIILEDSYQNLINKYNVLNPLEIINKKKSKLGYEHKKKYEWVLGMNLKTKKEIYVPANMVFFPYNRLKKNQHMVSQTTTGLSSGLRIEEAILQGILEVLERDAYTMCYLKKEKLVNLNLGNCKELKKIEKILVNLGFEIHLKLLLNSKQYNVYVVHCILEDKKRKYPIYTHGSGASLDIKIAIKRAIIEASQLRISQIELKELKDYFFEENKAYREWGEGKKECCYPFLKEEGDEERDIQYFKDYSSGNFFDDIRNLVDNLFMDGYNVYCVNLSRKETDFKVVRIIIPGMQDIDSYHDRLTKKLEKLDIDIYRNIFS